MADRAESGPLQFEPLHRRAAARIESTVTELVTVSNPFDYHTFMWGDRGAMAHVLHRCHGRAAGRHNAGARRTTESRRTTRPRGSSPSTRWPTRSRLTGGRAVVVATMAECSTKPFRDHIIHRGTHPAAGASARGWRHWTPPLSCGRTLRSGARTPSRSRARTRVVDEAEAKAQACALSESRCPAGIVAEFADVEAAASRSAIPVTLKALDLAHKSEAGAVRSASTDAAALTSALAAMPATEPATWSRRP